jgi:hypothetical protein
VVELGTVRAVARRIDLVVVRHTVPVEEVHHTGLEVVELRTVPEAVARCIDLAEVEEPHIDLEEVVHHIDLAAVVRHIDLVVVVLRTGLAEAARHTGLEVEELHIVPVEAAHRTVLVLGELRTDLAQASLRTG